jgi:hypothetical protein
MSITYILSEPYTSTSGEALYDIRSHPVSDILTTENEMYIETMNFSTESASRQTYYNDPEAQLEEYFNFLVRKWKAETKFCSTILEISMHPDYQQIIGMGKCAMPFILRELDTNGGHWFWALKAITGADPVPSTDKGNLAGMRDAWLSWGQHNGYEF